MPYDHLAGRAGRDVLVLVVHDPDLNARHRPAEAARANGAWLLVVEDDADHFGHSPDLDQRKTKALLKDGMKLRFDPGSNRKTYIVPAIGHAFWPAEQQRDDHAEIVHDARPGLSDLIPPALGVKSIR